MTKKGNTTVDFYILMFSFIQTLPTVMCVAIYGSKLNWLMFTARLFWSTMLFSFCKHYAETTIETPKHFRKSIDLKHWFNLNCILSIHRTNWLLS